MLVIDLDCQGDASKTLLDPGRPQLLTVDALFRDGYVPMPDLIVPSRFAGISVVPADSRLNEVDCTHGFQDSRLAHVLAEHVSSLSGLFDAVLYDCPPRSHLSGFAALVASDGVLVPVEPGVFALSNLESLNEEVRMIQACINGQLRVQGYFLSKVNPKDRVLRLQARQALEEAYGPHQVVETEVPLLAALASAINAGKPITQYRKKGTAAEVMRGFAREVWPEQGVRLYVPEEEGHGHGQSRSAA